MRSVKRVSATLPTLPVVALLIFAAVTPLGAFAVAPLAASASSPATQVRTVSLVGSTGHLKAGYKVVRHLAHASCQTGSFMTGRADRCTTPASRAVVLDPCWPTASSKTFVCQRRPWRHKIVLLHVPQPVSGKPGADRASLPWGMRIKAKVRCLLDPGSVRRVSGHALLFHCSHHRDIFGPLRRGSGHWKAHVYRTGARTRSGYRSLGWQPVRIVWYGAAPVSPSPSPTPTLLPTLTPSASATPTITASATPY